MHWTRHRQTRLLRGDIRRLIGADRLSNLLHISRAELATALGLSRDATSKSRRVVSPPTQARLRDVVEIMRSSTAFGAGPRTPQLVFAWYRSQPLLSFGDHTAETLGKEAPPDLKVPGKAGVLTFLIFDDDVIWSQILLAGLVAQALDCAMVYSDGPLRVTQAAIDDLIDRVCDHVADFLADIYLSPPHTC